jgi:dCMP deaminase
MTWDKWYHELCITVGKNSKCLSRHIGAVLVKDKSVVATGYNGPPRGLPTCSQRYILDPELQALLTRDGRTPSDEDIKNICPRYIAGFKSGEGLEWCVAGHAERNALINAAREGTSTKGSILYMDCGIPCTPCLVEIINAGVVEIVVTKMEFYDKSSMYTLDNIKLSCRLYDHLK